MAWCLLFSEMFFPSPGISLGPESRYHLVPLQLERDEFTQEGRQEALAKALGAWSATKKIVGMVIDSPRIVWAESLPEENTPVSSDYGVEIGSLPPS